MNHHRTRGKTSVLQIKSSFLQEFYEGMGCYFVEMTMRQVKILKKEQIKHSGYNFQSNLFFVTRIGYSKYLGFLGRHLRDFILNLL